MIKYAVEFKGVSKSFAAVRANVDLSFKIRQGSIHAIVGENGAGKSTAMKLLYGMHTVDTGVISVHDKDWGLQGAKWRQPSDAIGNGIGMVHQHFMLSPTETVLDNIILDSSIKLRRRVWAPSWASLLPRSAAIQKLQKIASLLNIELPLYERVQALPVGVQQRIEIVKLLFKDADILILDEPTAVLSPGEALELFDQLKKLSQLHKTIILITHKLKEVMQVSDAVTVMRAGKIVALKSTQATHPAELAHLMVGSLRPLSYEKPPVIATRPVLQAQSVSLVKKPRLIQAFSLELYPGEILGIAGVEGSGQKDFLELMIEGKSSAKKYRGTLVYKDQVIGQCSTLTLRKQGMAFVGDDRLTDSIVLDATVAENFLLGLQYHPAFHVKGIMRWSAIKKALTRVMQEYKIQPHRPQLKMCYLSGGNQQKLVMARELYLNPRLILLSQPTRGVDIGASQLIYEKILQHIRLGAAALLVSSELDEILALSHKVSVICAGQLSAKMDASGLDETTLGLLLGGAHHD